MTLDFKDWSAEKKYEWYLEERLRLLSTYTGGRIFPPPCPPPWDEAAMDAYHAAYGTDNKWDGRYDRRGYRGLRPWHYVMAFAIGFLPALALLWVLFYA